MRTLLSDVRNKEGSSPKLVVFENWGGGRVNTIENVFKEFMDSGFRMIFDNPNNTSKEGDLGTSFNPVTVFALENSPIAHTYYNPPHPIIFGIKTKIFKSKVIRSVVSHFL